jgi:hypothetical protein
MKKALVIALMFVLGLGIAAFAGPFSGSWTSELTIGFRDVVLAEDDFTVTVPGQTLNISGHTLTIADKLITIETSGGTYEYLLKYDPILIGPYDVIIPPLSIAIVEGVASIPAQWITVETSGGEYTYLLEYDPILIGPWDVIIPELPVTIVDGMATCPGYEGSITVNGQEIVFDVLPVLGELWGIGWVDFGELVMDPFSVTLDDACEFDTGPILVTIWAEDPVDGDTKSEEVLLDGLILTVDGPIADVDGVLAAGFYGYTWFGDDLYLAPQTPGMMALDDQLVQTSVEWDCIEQELIDGDLLLQGFQRILHVDLGGPLFEEVTITFPNFPVVVLCTDVVAGFVTVSGWAGNGTSTWGELFTVTLDDFQVNLTLTPGTVTTPGIYASVFFDQDNVDWWLDVEIPPRTFTLVFGDLCADECPTILLDLGGNVNLFSENWGLILVPGQEITIVVDGQEVSFTIPERECPVSGTTATFPGYTYTIPEEEIILPPKTVTILIDGEAIEVEVPAQTVPITGTTATFPGYTYTIEMDNIVIPPKTVTINVDGETISFTVPGGTYNLSGETLYIPAFTFTVPGFNQTIYKVPTLAFTSTLIVDYTVCGWVFNSTSKFDDTGWIAQSFAVTGTLGAFSVESSLKFVPATALFDEWKTKVSVSIAGVSFYGKFGLNLGEITGLIGSGWILGASGSVGDCDFGATAYFNVELDADGNWIVPPTTCFCFTSIDFDISFPFACIDLVDISLGFSMTGFDGVTFSIDGLAIPNMSWLTFDVDLTFDDGIGIGKSLTLTPKLNFGDFTCITIYGKFKTDGVSLITGFDIYGIGLTYTWNGVTFTSVSAMDPAYYVSSGLSVKSGEGDYWEAFQIKSAADACCGGAFDFSVTTFFDKNSAMLFDWGETVAKVSIGFGSNYTGSTSLTVSDAGFQTWTIGFTVTW